MDTGVTRFRRNTETGRLTLLDVTTFRVREVEGVEGCTLNLETPGIVISPNGRHVYVTSDIDEAIAIFARRETGELELQGFARAPRARLPSPPPHDECGQAQLISEFSFRDVVDTAAASIAPDDPELSCGAGGQQGHSVWYRFTAPDTGTVALTTINSSYNTVLAVHVGACGALSELACNDNFLDPLFLLANSALVVAVTGGVEYFVEVTNFGIRPGGLLDIFVQFSRGQFCSECETQQDCGEELSCFVCSQRCTGAPSRCASPAVSVVCEDGIF